MDYLVFKLYGPMASWGKIAVGQARHSESFPTKSSLIGLLAAALGIKRDEEARQHALAHGYHFAIKQLAIGTHGSDFHTAQAPDSVGKFQYRTRKDELELGRDRLGTVLSQRDYRFDALHLIAVNVLDTAPYSLADLKQALECPVYPLSLGRKSCPLAAPLGAEIITAQDVKQALDAYPEKKLSLYFNAENDLRPALPLSELTRYYWEGDKEALGLDDISKVETLELYDQPLSRARWQFSPRRTFLYQTGR